MIWDRHVVCSTEILMNMFRRKITACGYDISFENMADLKSGVEGELKDLIQTVLYGMIEGSQHSP